MFVVLVVLIFTLWIIYRKRVFSELKGLGILGPDPNLLFGNALEIINKTPIKCYQEWIEKYGKVVGYYFGTNPVVLIADVNLLKKIQVSNFTHFMNRAQIFRSQNVSKRRVEGFSNQMITLKDKKWKDLRSIITPSFTTSKMKQITPIMNGAIDSLVNNLKKKSLAGESFDIYKMYQGLTMDVIGRTAFGIQTDCQNNPHDPFLRCAKALFAGDIKNPLILLAVAFQSLSQLWSWLGRIRLTMQNEGYNPITNLVESVKEVIAVRRKNEESRRRDLLQLMLDAEIDDAATVSAADLTVSDEIHETLTTVSSSQTSKKMSDADVLDNSLLFFLAAYETTSTALAFTTHLLIQHPEVQEKVRKEVLGLLKSEGELNYVSVTKLQYLDQVINEALRLYPPIYMFVTRECGQDVELDKVRFKKGLAVVVAVYNLHRDPELWEDPDKFKPERFAPENKSKINPFAFQPFGAGPRNCVGMRFALMEVKLALARILSQYRLETCSKSEKELTLKIAFSILNPKNGVWVTVTPFEKEESNEEG